MSGSRRPQPETPRISAQDAEIAALREALEARGSEAKAPGGADDDIEPKDMDEARKALTVVRNCCRFSPILHRFLVSFCFRET